MSQKRKKVLGRGMAELVDGSFSSIIDPDGPKQAAPKAPEAAPDARAASPSQHATPSPGPAPSSAVHETGRAMTAAPVPDASPSAAAVAPAAARLFDVISITSGKGGTGKSILTSNLAVLLAQATRVTILDADLGLANIHILFNLMPRYNASHVITGEKTLDEVMIRGPRGVSIIPGGSGIPELANLTDFRFGALVSGIASLHRTTDLLLIDTPSGIDPQSLTFLLASDQVIVVTTEDVTAMTDAYAVIKTVMTRRPDSTVVVVVNQARSHTDGLETFRKISHVARKFIGSEPALGGVIPYDEKVERSVAERVPVTLSYPASLASRAMASIAGKIGTFHSRSPRMGQPFAARLKWLRSAPAPR